MPIQTSHKPVRQSFLEAANQAPTNMIPYATNCPLTLAVRVARVKSFVAPQTAARKILPPSRGNPGKRLKVATDKLMITNHWPAAPIASLDGKASISKKKKHPRKKLPRD